MHISILGIPATHRFQRMLHCRGCECSNTNNFSSNNNNSITIILISEWSI